MFVLSELLPLRGQELRDPCSMPTCVALSLALPVVPQAICDLAGPQGTRLGKGDGLWSPHRDERVVGQSAHVYIGRGRSGWLWKTKSKQ